MRYALIVLTLALAGCGGSTSGKTYETLCIADSSSIAKPWQATFSPAESPEDGHIYAATACDFVPTCVPDGDANGCDDFKLADGAPAFPKCDVISDARIHVTTDGHIAVDCAQFSPGVVCGGTSCAAYTSAGGSLGAAVPKRVVLVVD